MFDIGFQALSRLFASGMNVKVFVLDTQVYSNTGGQASTASYTGQNTKMSVHGKTFGGKQERRKEIAQIAMMHPRTYVAQTTCAHVNHFYKSVIGALEFDGPAIVVCYTTCQPEHGVADNMAGEQARLAVELQGAEDRLVEVVDVGARRLGHVGARVHHGDLGDLLAAFLLAVDRLAMHAHLCLLYTSPSPRDS